MYDDIKDSYDNCRTVGPHETFQSWLFHSSFWNFDFRFIVIYWNWTWFLFFRWRVINGDDSTKCKQIQKLWLNQIVTGFCCNFNLFFLLRNEIDFKNIFLRYWYWYYYHSLFVFLFSNWATAVIMKCSIDANSVIFNAMTIFSDIEKFALNRVYRFVTYPIPTIFNRIPGKVHEFQTHLFIYFLTRF